MNSTPWLITVCIYQRLYVYSICLTADTPDPTPEQEAAARAKEAEEQAALPYKWNQTIGDLDINFSVPGNYKSRDLVIEIKKQKLKAGVKGQDPIIDVCNIPIWTYCR